MDFIKVFIQAKELGLTKEEFLIIWETEAKLKLKADEAKILQLQQNNVPVSTNGKESTLQTLLCQQTEKTDWLINAVITLGENVDTLLNNLEQENHLTRRQFEEFRQQLKHLSDRLDIKMTAPNVSVTEGTSEERRGRASASPKFEVKSNLRPLASSFEVTRKENQDTMGNPNVPRADLGSVKPHNWSQSEGVTTNGHGELNQPNRSQSVWDVDDFPWNSIEQNNDDGFVGSSASANSKELHFQGTGKFADAISSMMIQEEIVNGENAPRENGNALHSNLGDFNGQSDFFEVVRKNGNRHRDAVKTDPAITLIPPKGAEFFIPNFKGFQSSGRDFFTETLYTRPKACRVRLRLWFNKRGGRLGVHLLVSQGHFDDRYKWPMIFRGKGYIFNQASQTYTKLWKIEPQRCSMPEKNKEVTLGASVCLETSRDPCEDVTADLLTRKRYVSDGDRLLFLWSIKADEIKADQQAADFYFQDSAY